MRTTELPDVASYSYAGAGYANPHAATQIANGVSTTTYAYDNNGNLTSAGTGAATTSYSYDYANRLIAILYNNATTSTYGYDVFGQRVYQISASTSAATTTYPFKFYSVASTTKSSTNFATSTEYVFNGDTLLATVDQAFRNGSATGTAQTRYIHPDHLGSTNVLTNASGTVVETLDYYPYGALRISSSVGGTDSARKYIGQFADMSGLNYLQARYQDPQRGQFMSQDPTFLALSNPDQLKQISQQDQQAFLSDPQQLNSYSYARNNPISSKDPNGRSALSGGFDFSAWNFTGSAGLNFDQYGIDYYYGWGIAAGVHTGANAGITTDDLSHAYSLTSSGFAAAGDFYGGEVSYGMTQYPYTKKPSQQSMVMTGGINFGDAAGVRSVVSGPLLVLGSRPQTTFPTIAGVMAQNASISAAGNASTLPATVTVGGITYYRNYSGLLSTTAAQSTPPVIGRTINNNTSGSSASGASLFQLHVIVPH